MTAGVQSVKTVGVLVRELLDRQPDRIALAVDDGSSLTLGEWVRRSGQVAAGLRAEGVLPGDRVGVVVGPADWLDYAVAELAVLLAGGTAICLSDRLGSQTVASRLSDCLARLVVCSELAELTGELPPMHRVSELQAAGQEVGWSFDDLPVQQPSEIAEIVYTSGTTGPAKQVAVSHASLTFGRDSGGELFGGIESILCVVEPGTNAGHAALLVALTTGSRAQLLRRLDADSIARAVERDRIQHAILPTGAAADLLHSGAHLRHDLSSLRVLMFGSSWVPDQVVDALSRAVPDAQIMIGYGSTESTPAFTRRMAPAWNEHRDTRRHRRTGLASLGRPGGGTEVRIVGPDGADVAAGAVGEIWLRSGAPTRYYLGETNSDRQLPVFRPDGWVRMGDLGTLGEDGTLHFVDRLADGIVRDGRYISSVMIENALLWHPRVRSAAVVGVPDAGRGSRPVAVLELHASDGETLSPDSGRQPVDTETTLAEIAEFLAAELPPADRPAEIIAVPRLPRGQGGKILKRQLREDYVHNRLPTAQRRSGRAEE